MLAPRPLNALRRFYKNNIIKNIDSPARLLCQPIADITGAALADLDADMVYRALPVARFSRSAIAFMQGKPRAGAGASRG